MPTRTDFTQPQAGLLGEARTQKVFGRRVTVLAADLVTANVIEAFVVPAGFTVTGIIAVSTDLDAGTNAMTLSVGDAASATRYLNASTIGQAGGIASAFTTPAGGTNLLFAYTVDTKILITITLGPTVAAAGTIDLYLTGFVAG